MDHSNSRQSSHSIHQQQHQKYMHKVSELLKKVYQSSSSETQNLIVEELKVKNVIPKHKFTPPTNTPSSEQLHTFLSQQQQKQETQEQTQ